MQLCINPTYEHLREWICSLPTIFPTSGTVIYDARNQIRVIEHKGIPFNVKRFHCPALPNRLIYSTLRPPKAVRAYHNAERLHTLGIATPEAVAYILMGNGLIQESYLVTLQVPYTRNFYEFRYHDVAGYEDIIRAFARFTANMHIHGVVHKDYSPGNILFDKKEDGDISICIVDINRMDFGNKPVGMETACKNLCRLWGRRDFIHALSEEYAAARGWNAQQVEQRLTYYWEHFWHFKSDADIERIFSR